MILGRKYFTNLAKDILGAIRLKWYLATAVRQKWEPAFKSSGDANDYNELAEKIIGEIMFHPKSILRHRAVGDRAIFEIHHYDGRAVTLYTDGQFRGFLEPKDATITAYEVRVASDERDVCFVEICSTDYVIADVSREDAGVVVKWFGHKDTQTHLCSDLIDALQKAQNQV